MRPLTAQALLTAWERGLSQPPSQRALTLLATAYPERSTEELAQLSIGQRDALLMDVRKTAFGSTLVSVAACPTCGERLELALDIADIRIESDCVPAAAFSLDPGGYRVEFRLPDSRDLALIENHTELADARNLLLKRCLLSVKHDDQDQTVAELPADLVSKIESAMAQADPQANVQLALACPACQHRWAAAFDIASFLWGEIHAWAGHILREVHALAKTYGWSEDQILALSPARRKMYLDLDRVAG